MLPTLRIQRYVPQNIILLCIFVLPLFSPVRSYAQHIFFGHFAFQYTRKIPTHFSARKKNQEASARQIKIVRLAQKTRSNMFSALFVHTHKYGQMPLHCSFLALRSQYRTRCTAPRKYTKRARAKET